MMKAARGRAYQAINTRTLAQKIDGMLYQRTALSKKPDKIIRKELATARARLESRAPNDGSSTEHEAVSNSLNPDKRRAR